MLCTGCDVTRQKVPKVAGTCIFQLMMAENYVTQKLNAFVKINMFDENQNFCQSYICLVLHHIILFFHMLPVQTCK